MNTFKIDQFDPSESQLFLTSIKLYNLRSEKSYAKIIKETSKLRIDGMLTNQNKERWWGGIYDQSGGIFIVDGIGYKARFDNFRKPKTMLNFTDEGELCLMLIHSIMFESQDMEDNELFEPIKSNTNWGHIHFSFVLNTKLPSVDILAARLMMDE